MKHTKNMIYVPSQEARELTLYAANSSDIYFRNIKPVVASLAKKMRRGEFNKELAIDAFYHVACESAKTYYRDFCYMYSGFKFYVSDRYTAASDLLDMFIDDIKELAASA